MKSVCPFWLLTTDSWLLMLYNLNDFNDFNDLNGF